MNVKEKTDLGIWKSREEVLTGSFMDRRDAKLRPWYLYVLSVIGSSSHMDMSIEIERNSPSLVIYFAPGRVSQHGNISKVRSFSGGGIGRRAALLMQYIGGSMPSPRAICLQRWKRSQVF